MAEPCTSVLVIDDERPLAAIVASYLSKAGFDPAVAYTGPDGVRSAQDLDPDVIILDLGLPGLDGVEVCRQLRLFSDCYILILTARAAKVDKPIGLSVGADDYLTKPFSPRELVARVNTVVSRPRHQAATTQPAAPRESGRLRVEAERRVLTKS